MICLNIPGRIQKGSFIHIQSCQSRCRHSVLCLQWLLGFSTAYIRFSSRGKELTRTFTFALAVGLLAWSDWHSTTKICNKYWRSKLSNWPNCSQNKCCVLLNLLLWILLFSVHIKGRFWMSLETFHVRSCRFPYFMYDKKRAHISQHLSSQQSQSSTSTLDVPGYKGVMFWLVL